MDQKLIDDGISDLSLLNASRNFDKCYDFIFIILSLRDNL